MNKPEESEGKSKKRARIALEPHDEKPIFDILPDGTERILK